LVCVESVVGSAAVLVVWSDDETGTVACMTLLSRFC
jgi:hypothetical protein